MAQTQNKTQPTDQDVLSFIATIPDETKRRDSEELVREMSEITGEKPRMWGPSIVGFGQYHYKYESGREGDAPAAGFSPRKASLTLYLMEGFDNQKDLLAKLGPHKLGKGCLYIQRLEDISMPILRQLIKQSYDDVLKRYPA